MGVNNNYRNFRFKFRTRKPFYSSSHSETSTIKSDGKAAKFNISERKYKISTWVAAY